MNKKKFKQVSFTFLKKVGYWKRRQSIGTYERAFIHLVQAWVTFRSAIFIFQILPNGFGKTTYESDNKGRANNILSLLTHIFIIWMFNL